LRKVDILFKAFEAAGKEVEYYALDLSLPELKRTFAEINTKAYKYVSFHGLHGTYDDGLTWLKKPQGSNKSTCVLTMGSSLGNFSREGACAFLSSFKDALSSSDLLIVGLDGCQQSDRVFNAYNDGEHITEQFYRNGLSHANSILGYEAFKQEDWKVEGLYDEKLDKHQASYVALKNVETKDFSFHEGEKIHLEDAFKYSQAQADQLWHDAGLVQQMAYGNNNDDYCECSTVAVLHLTDACSSPSSLTCKNRIPSRSIRVCFDTDPQAG
jgi:EasF-like predicted methyltransferase